jgi:hypothetical protein
MFSAFISRSTNKIIKASCFSFKLFHFFYFSGLCGVFDGNKNNDLQKSNGVLHDVPGIIPELFSLT